MAIASSVCRYFVALVAAGALMPACASPTASLRRIAAADLRCAESQLRLHRLSRKDWEVNGCGNTESYSLVGARGDRQWKRRSEVEPRLPRRYAVILPAPPPPVPEPIVQETNTDSALLLGIDLFIPSTGLVLQMRGAPQRDPVSVQLQLVRRAPPFKFASCEFKVVANGRLLPLPKGEFQQSSFKEQLNFLVPFLLVSEMGEAARVVGEVCAQRFELKETDLVAIRKFATRYQEERALKGAVSDPALPPGESNQP